MFWKIALAVIFTIIPLTVYAGSRAQVNRDDASEILIPVDTSKKLFVDRVCMRVEQDGTISVAIPFLVMGGMICHARPDWKYNPIFKPIHSYIFEKHPGVRVIGVQFHFSSGGYLGEASIFYSEK